MSFKTIRYHVLQKKRSFHYQPELAVLLVPSFYCFGFSFLSTIFTIPSLYPNLIGAQPECLFPSLKGHHRKIKITGIKRFHSETKNTKVCTIFDLSIHGKEQKWYQRKYLGTE